MFDMDFSMRKASAEDYALRLTQMGFFGEMTEKAAADDEIFDPVWFVKAPPSFCVGYAFQMLPEKGALRLRFTQTGILPEIIQNDPSVKIVAKVRLVNSKSARSVCLVRSGKPQKSQSVDFPKVHMDTVRTSSLVFKLSLDRGLFRRNQVIAKWTVPLTKCERVKETYDWQNIVFNIQ